MSVVSSAWLCQLYHEPFGPLNEEQLREMAEQGQLTADSLVRPADGSSNWQPLSETSLASLLPTGPTTRTAPIGATPFFEPSSASNPSLAAAQPQVQPAVVQPGVVPQPSGVIPSAAAQPVTGGLPVGQAMPGAPVAPVAPAAETPVTPANAGPAPLVMDGDGDADPRARFRQRKKNHMPLIIGLSILGLVGIVGTAIALTQGSGDEEQPAEQTASSESDQPATPDGVTAAPEAPPTLNRAAEVRTWVKDVGRKITTRELCAVQLNAVWLEGDSMFAEVEMTYQGATPVRFLSWNSTEAPELAAARLVYPGESGRVELTGAASEPRTVAKGDVVRETLQFPAPASGAEKALLLLPKEALGRSSSPYGFEITAAMWLAGVSPSAAPPATPPQDPAESSDIEPTQPSDETTPGETMPEAGPSTPPAPAPATDSSPPPEEDDLPSFEDLQKSIKSTAGPNEPEAEPKMKAPEPPDEPQNESPESPESPEAP